jgi:C2 domain/Filamin/ABP280 repeat
MQASFYIRWLRQELLRTNDADEVELLLGDECEDSNDEGALCQKMQSGCCFCMLIDALESAKVPSSRWPDVALPEDGDKALDNLTAFKERLGDVLPPPLFAQLCPHTICQDVYSCSAKLVFSIFRTVFDHFVLAPIARRLSESSASSSYSSSSSSSSSSRSFAVKSMSDIEDRLEVVLIDWCAELCAPFSVGVTDLYGSFFDGAPIVALAASMDDAVNANASLNVALDSLHRVAGIARPLLQAVDFSAGVDRHAILAFLALVWSRTNGRQNDKEQEQEEAQDDVERRRDVGGGGNNIDDDSDGDEDDDDDEDDDEAGDLDLHFTLHGPGLHAATVNERTNFSVLITNRNRDHAPVKVGDALVVYVCDEDDNGARLPLEQVAAPDANGFTYFYCPSAPHHLSIFIEYSGMSVTSVPLLALEEDEEGEPSIDGDDDERCDSEESTSAILRRMPPVPEPEHMERPPKPERGPVRRLAADAADQVSVQLEGDILSLVRVDQCVKFRIGLSGPGAASLDRTRLDVRVERALDNAQLALALDRQADGSYSASFQPPKPGDHRVVVLIDGVRKAIKPMVVQARRLTNPVAPRSSSSSSSPAPSSSSSSSPSSSTSNDSLRRKTLTCVWVNETAKITLGVRDDDGKPVVPDVKLLDVSIGGPSGASVQADIKPFEGGCSIEFLPTESGVYRMQITNAGIVTPFDPILAKVRASKPLAELTRVVVGHRNRFVLGFRDSRGNPQAPKDLKVRITGPCGPVDVHIDGCSVSYVPDVPGQFDITVLTGGTATPIEPVVAIVSPAAVAAAAGNDVDAAAATRDGRARSATRLSESSGYEVPRGSGIDQPARPRLPKSRGTVNGRRAQRVVLGKRTSFIVALRGRGGQLIDRAELAGQAGFAVEISGPRGKVDAALSAAANEGYRVHFTPDAEGVFSITVHHSGRVTEMPPMRAVRELPPRQVTLGEPASLSFHLKRSTGSHIDPHSKSVAVEVRDASGKPVPARVAVNAPICRIQFEPSQVGLHTVVSIINGRRHTLPSVQVVAPEEEQQHTQPVEKEEEEEEEEKKLWVGTGVRQAAKKRERGPSLLSVARGEQPVFARDVDGTFRQVDDDDDDDERAVQFDDEPAFNAVEEVQFQQVEEHMFNAVEEVQFQQVEEHIETPVAITPRIVSSRPKAMQPPAHVAKKHEVDEPPSIEARRQSVVPPSGQTETAPVTDAPPPPTMTTSPRTITDAPPPSTAPPAGPPADDAMVRSATDAPPPSTAPPAGPPPAVTSLPSLGGEAMVLHTVRVHLGNDRLPMYMKRPNTFKTFTIGARAAAEELRASMVDSLLKGQGAEGKRALRKIIEEDTYTLVLVPRLGAFDSARRLHRTELVLEALGKQRARDQQVVALSRAMKMDPKQVEKRLRRKLQRGSGMIKTKNAAFLAMQDARVLVAVMEARDLSASFFGKDLYCTLLVNAQKFSTGKARAPQLLWNERFEFGVNDVSDQTLQLVVRDGALGPRDERGIVGRIDVPLDVLSATQQWQKWFPLECGGGASGSINLCIAYSRAPELMPRHGTIASPSSPLSGGAGAAAASSSSSAPALADEPKVKMMSAEQQRLYVASQTQRLFVTVRRAADVDSASSDATLHCVVTFGSQTKRTRSAAAGGALEWPNDRLEFGLSSLGTDDTVEVTLIDSSPSNPLSSRDVLGSVRVPLGHLVPDARGSSWHRMGAPATKRSLVDALPGFAALTSPPPSPPLSPRGARSRSPLASPPSSPRSASPPPRAADGSAGAGALYVKLEYETDGAWRNSGSAKLYFMPTPKVMLQISIFYPTLRMRTGNTQTLTVKVRDDDDGLTNNLRGCELETLVETPSGERLWLPAHQHYANPKVGVFHIDFTPRDPGVYRSMLHFNGAPMQHKIAAIRVKRSRRPRYSLAFSSSPVPS